MKLAATVSATIILFAVARSAQSQRRNSQDRWIDSINPLNWFSQPTDLSVNADPPIRRRPNQNRQFFRRTGIQTPINSEIDDEEFSFRARPRRQHLAEQAAQRRAINVDSVAKEENLPDSDLSGSGKDSSGNREYGKVARPTTECICRCDCCDCCPCNGEDLFYIDK